ncbi:DUF4115 domain-containing protein [Spiractinospora alimapuensis]|uniref:helix-turn-helix domain-containing protein n=1 Tax=Spiractinospora alimapuensis TaxID=2820884 RepID=UPI001F26641E|nr:RodZ domain-containing protein [Spiractinospora alimapuensis]QVQ53642.1 DUF4115 domain-containing protein [Spiractinospora alimapuensis]
MTIGETLGAARRQMGLSVEELSERIRVRDHIIEAIERDEFSECGGAFYARGHIRSLSRFLLVDEDPLIEEFNATHAERVGHSVEEIFATRRRGAAAERPRVRWTLLMAGACVIAAGAVAGYGYLNDDSSEAHTASAVIRPADDADTAGKDSPAAEPREHTSGDQPPDQAETADDGETDDSGNKDADEEEDVTLRIRAEERTWLSVTDSSGADLFTGIMLNGDERDWADDEELKLVVGNTNGVTMEVNDTEHESVGGSGDVAHLTLTPEGVE